MQRSIQTLAPGFTLNLWQQIQERNRPPQEPITGFDDGAKEVLEHLNPYSRKVAEALFRAVPELIPHAQVDQSPGAPDGTLLIRISQPHEGNEPGLYIATDAGETTVGFRACYLHFTDYEKAGSDEHIDRAVAHVRDLLEDRIVIKKWYRSGILCGSSLDNPSVLPSPSRSGITTVQMISWSGKADNTILVPAAY